VGCVHLTLLIGRNARKQKVLDMEAGKNGKGPNGQKGHWIPAEWVVKLKEVEPCSPPCSPSRRLPVAELHAQRPSHELQGIGAPRFRQAANCEM